MKRNWICLILALTLLLGCSAVPAWASEDGLPKVGETLHGFTVTERAYQSTLDADMLTMEHVASGASLVYLATDDPEKTFQISFHAPTLDNTGLTHVLEHMLMCGSEKYPENKLSIALENQTFASFYNASTQNGLNTYNVASLSENQLMLLMDYMMSGVFQPLFLHDPRIFQREAWRYTTSGGSASVSVTGTVYREMQQNTSDAGLFNLVMGQLFPGTTLGNRSGGIPQELLTLTPERVTEYYQTYYTASNSQIVLTGKMDLARFLQFLDETYLAQMPKVAVNISTELPTESASELHTVTYDVTTEAELERGTVCRYAYALDSLPADQFLTAQFLVSILNDGDSFAMEQLYEALPDGSFRCTLDTTSAKTPVLTFVASDLNEDEIPIFQKAVQDLLIWTISKNHEIDTVGMQETLTQAIMQGEAMREGYGFGISLAWEIAENWKNNLPLLPSGNQLTALQRLNARMVTEDVRNLLRVHVVPNKHRTLVAMVPKVADAQTDSAMTELLSRVSLEEVAAETAQYEAWVDAPLKEEVLASLQAVTKDSIPEMPALPAVQRTMLDGMPLYMVEAANTAYTRSAVYLPIDSLTEKELQALYLYTMLVGVQQTEKYSPTRVATLISRQLIGLDISPAVIDLPSGEERLMLVASWDGESGKEKINLELLNEILFHTRTTLSTNLLSYLGDSYRQSMQSSPDSVQHNRAQAGFSNASRAMEAMVGWPFYDSCLQDDEDVLYDLRKHMKNAVKKIQSREGMIITYIGNETGMQEMKKAARTWCATIPYQERTRANYTQIPAPGKREAIIAPTTLQCNAISASYKALGIENPAEAMVYTSILTDRFLMPQLRFKRGTYDARATASAGGLFVQSYCDPDIESTFALYDRMAEFVAGYTPTQAEIDRYVLSCIGHGMVPKGGMQAAEQAVYDALSGWSAEDQRAEIEAIKQITPETWKAFVPALEQLSQAGARSIVANMEKITLRSAQVDSILDLMPKEEETTEETTQEAA